jgi:hypothetical protein
LADNFHILITDTGKLPVLITLTGEDHGQSKKLSFESIKHCVTAFVSETTVQVPLEVAVDFILAQNEVEIAAFGIQPDPVESTRRMRNGLGIIPRDMNRKMRSHGGVDEPIEGPSSIWVDTSIYTGWASVSAREDEILYQREEKNWRWNMIRRAAGLDSQSGRPCRRCSI